MPDLVCAYTHYLGQIVFLKRNEVDNYLFGADVDDLDWDKIFVEHVLKVDFVAFLVDNDSHLEGV